LVGGHTWRRRLWWAVGAMAVAALALRVAVGVRAAARVPPAPSGAAAQDAGTPLGGTPAPGFRLVDQFGRPVSLASLRGRAVVLAFVDSQCTTICPLTAATLAEAQDDLGPLARRVALVAVNVNPAASSVADVWRWSAEHGMLHRWEFLTGSPAALERVWRAYHVYVQVLDGAVMHDPAVYVIDPAGRERTLFETQPDPAAPALRAQAEALAQAVAAALGVPWSRPAAPQQAPAVVLPRAGAFVAAPVRAPAGWRGPVRVGEGQPALVDFFASSCEACAQELPVLAAYARAARTAGLPDPVLVYLASGGFGPPPHLGARTPFPVVADARGRLAAAYGVTALPYLALTAADGRIVWRHVGVLSLGALEAAVRAHLGR
jgi:cytochrome oxidase Cu insertion factor (SCO1/SenC/PrrC family)/thiol-disulfide isomerase/thioredoxin